MAETYVEFETSELELTGTAVDVRTFEVGGGAKDAATDIATDDEETYAGTEDGTEYEEAAALA